jgi:hypothetical protein
MVHLVNQHVALLELVEHLERQSREMAEALQDQTVRGVEFAIRRMGRDPERAARALTPLAQRDDQELHDPWGELLEGREAAAWPSAEQRSPALGAKPARALIPRHEEAQTGASSPATASQRMTDCSPDRSPTG